MINKLLKEKTMKIKNYFLTTMACLVMAGCATTPSNLCIVPEAKDSVICELAGKLKTTPEAISQTLKITNIVAMETNVYTAQQADKFVDRMIEEIQGMRDLEITYIGLVRYIDGEVSLLPPRVQVVFEVMGDSGLTTQEIKMPLTPYDFELLLRHLQKQKELIKMYLKE
jgi:hypothetical protein